MFKKYFVRQLDSYLEVHATFFSKLFCDINSYCITIHVTLYNQKNHLYAFCSDTVFLFDTFFRFITSLGFVCAVGQNGDLATVSKALPTNFEELCA
jgi:hypothetical protein